MPDSTVTEIWKPVPGYEGFYEVSDQGRVRSVDRVIKTRTGDQFHKSVTLKPARGRGGHLSVALLVNGKSKTHQVHALVMSAFVGKQEEGMDICHYNGNPADNRLSNLRYDTRSGNIRDTVRHGRHNQGKKTHCKHGHPFDLLNTRLAPDGERVCRTCAARRIREHRARKRGAQKPNCLKASTSASNLRNA